MIILHVITDLGTGGAELMLKRLIHAHSHDTGYTHLVVSLRSKGTVGPELEEMGVRVQALGLKGAWGLPRVISRLSRIIAETRPDVVQTWMYHADLVGGLAAMRAGHRNVIWGVRVADIFPEMGVPRATLAIRRLCSQLSYWLPQRILYVAHSARTVHELIGYDPSKSVVIPNGYELPAAPRLHTWRAQVRSELELGKQGLLIGTAGRYSPQKGYRAFVEAAARLCGHYPDLRLLMAGRGVDWENEELAGWVRATGYADRFHLLGERKDIHKWLAALDIFVLYSLGEGFPNIVAEAMSVEVPCIVTDVGDAALLVGETGTVLEAGDREGLLKALQGLIAAGQAGRRSLGKKARQRIETEYSMDSVARRFEELYGTLVSSGLKDSPGAVTCAAS